MIQENFLILLKKNLNREISLYETEFYSLENKLVLYENEKNFYQDCKLLLMKIDHHLKIGNMELVVLLLDASLFNYLINIFIIILII